jgi:predicted enzyme related to lactoylglutathione lyase
MSEHDEAWADGTPCWVDLVTDDIDRARAFYGEVFGWQTEEGSPEFGGYSMATLKGRAVAGLAPPPPGQSMPSAWTTYLATSDADATAAKVIDNGGQLVFPVMDVADVGRMGLGTDPSGSPVAFWQAGTHTGFGLANEPGTDVWNEYMTSDYEGAKKFYGAVFGVTFKELDGADEYSTMHVADGREVGGVGAKDPDGFVGWRTYFAAADADVAAATTERLGGTVLSPVADTQFGRMGHLADPGGAVFAVIGLGG